MRGNFKKLLILILSLAGACALSAFAACSLGGGDNGGGENKILAYENHAVIVKASDYENLRDGWYGENIYGGGNLISDEAAAAAVTTLDIGADYCFVLTTRGTAENVYSLKLKMNVTATSFTEEIFGAIDPQTLLYDGYGDEDGVSVWSFGYNGFLSPEFNFGYNISAMGTRDSQNVRLIFVLWFTPTMSCELNFEAGIFPAEKEQNIAEYTAYSSPADRAEITDFATYFVPSEDARGGEIDDSKLIEMNGTPANMSELNTYYMVSDFNLGALNSGAANKRLTMCIVFDNAEAVTATIENVPTGDYTEQELNDKKFISLKLSVPEDGARGLRIILRVIPQMAGSVKVSYCFNGDEIGCAGLKSGECAGVDTLTLAGKMLDGYGNAFYMNADGVSCTIVSAVVNNSWYTLPTECNGIPVTGIGAGTFKDNTTIEYVTIHEGVTAIGESAFEGCTKLRRVNYSDSLFNRIYLPSTVKVIGDRAFYGMEYVYTVNVPTDCEEIGKDAFAGNTWLNTVSVPFTGARRGAVGAESRLTYTFGSVNMVYTVTVKDEDIIGEYAFNGCKHLKTVTYSKPVREIKGGAFSGCSALTAVDISGVEIIGDDAFNNCTSLKEPFLPDTLKEIGDYAFYYCKLFSVITIPESVEVIGDHVFDSCTQIYKITCYSDAELPEGFLKSFANLTTVELSPNITKVDDRMFYGMTYLKSVTMTGVTEIGDYAFANTALTEMNFGAVTSIGNYAFSGCTLFNAYNLPETLVELGEGAFYNSRNIFRITIPEGITRIPNKAFSLSGLTYVTFHDGVTEIGDYAFSNSKIGGYTFKLGNGIKTVGNYAFTGCTNVWHMILNDGLESIGDYAFKSSKLLDITIPASVKRIGISAFAQCTSIQKIEFEQPTGWYNIETDEETDVSKQDVTPFINGLGVYKKED